MPGTSPEASENRPAVARRALLTGGAAGVGTLLGLGAGLGIPALRDRGTPQAGPPGGVDPSPEADRSSGIGGELPGFGGEALPCHGAHQAGVTTTPPAAHARYVSYRLRPETDRDGIRRMLRILTGDVEGLASGTGPLADPEPELAARPARLTVTVGVGPGLVDRVDPLKRPEWLAPLPPFSRDRLSGQHDGGDLLVLLQADDPLPIAHAARMLARDLASFAEPLWTQQGFRQARGAEAGGTTMRNLMGQVDGTVNPSPADEDFDGLVWIGGAPEDASRDGRGGAGAWLEGGTALVLRRIRMELDTWDQVDRPGREQTIGRRLDTGAPLTGGDEHTPVDYEARNALGLTVIPSFAHVRRAHSEDPDERIFRRAVNYDDGAESGLLFACYQRNPLRQFVPIQRRLDELDLLNEWVTHTGSAVFAILPGFEPGETLGAALLE
ncbi:Dyp-type peroxidase [Leucobacter sp. CSA1]|uniref:Dyp-type peroxidase n=1 Tax=Leucobacter chromiisoli TaxID=2796471 RepID=A0A934UUA8_9MICO|nr:Dyp-type peroxidase [Leucobacter chromiisoli]MBK0419284.1 Dyp-type peroxidase [Leucobacter chromiisoli]